MSHPSKAKGNRLERLVVKMAEKAGLSAKRAYASNGESLGEAEDVDVLIDGNVKVQCKSRKKIATYITPPESCDITVVKENRGEVLAVLPLETLLNMYWHIK
mgnify:CR=1 FL=1